MDNDDKYYEGYFEVVMRVDAASAEEAQSAMEDELEKLPDVDLVNCTCVQELND